MIRSELLLCLFGMTACLITGTVAREAIIGGIKAAFHDFPYQVTLKQHDWIDCGGGIIDDHHILTAAHCVVLENGEITRERMFVLAGTNDLNNTHIRARVQKVFVPKEFKVQNINTNGDIAVLKLLDSLDLNKYAHLRHLELPKDEHYHGKTVRIAGFGWQWIRQFMTTAGIRRKGGNSDFQLRYTEAVVLNDRECQAGYRNQHLNFKKEFCARVIQRGDTHGVCTGDSGSPLVLDGKIVIGILSAGSPNCSEKLRAAIYTRVAHYLSLIDHAKHDREHADIRSSVLDV